MKKAFLILVIFWFFLIPLFSQSNYELKRIMEEIEKAAEWKSILMLTSS